MKDIIVVVIVNRKGRNRGEGKREIEGGKKKEKYLEERKDEN